MDYDLKRLILMRGVRRPSITLPPQHVPSYVIADLAEATLAPVRVWERSRTTLIKAYEAALSQMTTDAADDDLNAAILAVDLAAQQAIVSALPIIESWLAQFARRHARRFSSMVRSSTRIDPWPYIDVQRNADGIAAFQRRIASLIKDIGEQARKDVSEIVWRGVIERTPARKVGKEIAERLQVSRNRANFIASDQSNKVNAFLTEIRQEEAGIDEFMWETAEDSRVREEHRRLQGKVFKWKKPPPVGLPGTPPRCRCTGRAHIDLSS